MHKPFFDTGPSGSSLAAGGPGETVGAAVEARAGAAAAPASAGATVGAARHAVAVSSPASAGPRTGGAVGAGRQFGRAATARPTAARVASRHVPHLGSVAAGSVLLLALEESLDRVHSALLIFLV